MKKQTEPQWPESSDRAPSVIDEHQVRLRRWVPTIGLRRAADLIGVGEFALMRAMAGLGCYVSNRRAIERFLDAGGDK
jgi:hypothetical protein